MCTVTSSSPESVLESGISRVLLHLPSEPFVVSDSLSFWMRFERLRCLSVCCFRGAFLKHVYVEVFDALRKRLKKLHKPATSFKLLMACFILNSRMTLGVFSPLCIKNVTIKMVVRWALPGCS